MFPWIRSTATCVAAVVVTAAAAAPDQSFQPPSIPHYTPPPSIPSYTPPSTPSFQQFNTQQSMQRDMHQMNQNFRQQSYSSQMNNYQSQQNWRQEQQMRDIANRDSLNQQLRQNDYNRQLGQRAVQDRLSDDSWRNPRSTGSIRSGSQFENVGGLAAGRPRRGFSFEPASEPVTIADPSPLPTFGNVPVGTKFYFPNDLDQVYLWIKTSDTVANNLKNGRYAAIPPATPITVTETATEERAPAQATPKQPPKDLLPKFRYSLPEGDNTLRVRNPNNYDAVVGLRAGSTGVNFTVRAHGSSAVQVPDGSYKVYFQFSDRLDSLYEGDSVSLAGNVAEIQLVSVPAGNYGLRQVK